MSPTIARVSEVESVQPLGVRIGPELTVGGTYFQTLVQRGPLAYWRLGELGFVQDVIGDHYGVFVHTPSTVGEPALAASLVPGEPNPSILLGTGVSIQVPYGTWMDTEDFSFEGVFEITGTTTTPGAVVVRASVEKFCWGLLLDGDQLELTTSAQSDSMTLTNGVYHYVVTGDMDDVRLFLNGVEELSLPAEPDMNTGGAFSFGAVLPGFSYEAFPGRLDEYVYYDFKLSSLDAYADYLLWSTGQAGSIDMLIEDSAVQRPVFPRIGGEVITYRRALLEDSPWALWLNHEFLNGESGAFAWMGYYTTVWDFGERAHEGTIAFRGTLPAVSAPGYIYDRLLGIDTVNPPFGDHEIENPTLMSPSIWVESEDYIATSEFTVSGWLLIPPGDDPYTTEIPLLCCAPSLGASTFDKALYLDTARRLCWRTGVGGSVETIVDPTPFPDDNVPRHVAVTVGPDGTNIRVHGVTVATGSNTASWTTAQKVFLFAGGDDGTLNFDFGDSWDASLTFQASIYDVQLSDARLDRHNRIGRSYRNTISVWGYPSPTLDRTGEHLSHNTGNVWGTYSSSGATPEASIVPAEPNRTTAFSFTTPASVLLGTSSAIDDYIFTVPIRLSTTSGTQRLASFTVFSYSGSGTILNSYYDNWSLKVESGALVWRGLSTTNTLIVADTFTHSQTLVAGQSYNIGLWQDGATVHLWINGDRDVFTRSESGGWSGISAGNQTTYMMIGGIYTTGTLPTPTAEMFTGVMDEPYFNIPNPGSAGTFGPFQIPELFFEDLAMVFATTEQSLSNLVSSETVFELEVSLDVANQAITIDMVDETDSIFSPGQIPPMIQTLVEVDTVHVLIQAGDPADTVVQGVGQVTLVDESLEFFAAELRLRILDPTVVRAPTSITVMLSGGVPYEDVVFAIDGVPVYTVSLDSDGNLGPTSINVNVTLGTMGDHLLSVTQTTSEGVTADSQTFTVLRDPSPFPGVAGVDAPPVEVPGALVFEGGHLVRHWVFQDLLAEVDGGIGSYVLPHNPRNMTSPHLEHALTSRHSTAHDGKIHIFQAGNTPKEWQFTGYCPSEQQQAKMMEYRNLNRRFYVIDHRNRAWKVAMTSAVFVPRLRQNYNGIPTDWGFDFTMTAVVLDQNYLTPVEV